MPLPVWTAKEEAGEIEAEYVVDALVAEKGVGTERSFLVKWQVRPESSLPAFQLYHPGEFGKSAPQAVILS